MTITGSHRAAPPEDGFTEVRLTGPSPILDRRTTAIKGDIIDIGLAGRVSASRYVRPEAMQCARPRAALRDTPDAGAVAVSELVFGEGFDVFDVSGGWSWGRSVHDHYLGWVESAALTVPGLKPKHRVVARRAPVFAAPDIKAATIAELPFGARLRGEVAGEFLALVDGGFVHGRHIAAGLSAKPAIAMASVFTGAPYLWGGRTPDGVDCSGLVQAALAACGIAAPRDSDQQCAALGKAVAFADRQACDLIFFPGHVGILVSRDKLFHANAYWMTTLEESLSDVIARLEAAGVAEPVLAVKRL